MKFNRFCSFSSFSTNLSSIIKNIEYPVCKDCIHFIKYNVTEYDSYPIDKPIKMSKCNKFGIKDLISGKIDYESTHTCRYNKEKCGLSGKNFYPLTKINKIEL
jgi:hypothetical protein